MVTEKENAERNYNNWSNSSKLDWGNSRRQLYGVLKSTQSLKVVTKDCETYCGVFFLRNNSVLTTIEKDWFIWIFVIVLNCLYIENVTSYFNIYVCNSSKF